MNTKAVSHSDNDSLLLAENLRALLKSQNVDINQLAQALEIPPMTVRRLLSGETTDPRISTLKLVADHFGVTVDSLLEKNNPIPTASKRSKPYFVPLIDWNTAEKIKTIKELDLSGWADWQSITLTDNDPLGKNAFALESRPSMYPRFPHGTVFIIDPDIEPSDGDIVLVKIRKNSELTLRELLIDPPEWILQPVVSGSTKLTYSTQEHIIVGVNVLTLLYNRRST